MLTADDASELLSKFPKVDFAFAYGSGAIEQGGYNYTVNDDDEGAKLPMLDLILAVDDPILWHK